MEITFEGISFSEPGFPDEPWDESALASVCRGSVPDEYREFLKRVNGGIPYPSGYRPTFDDEPDAAQTLVANGPNPILNDIANYAILPSRVACFYGLGRSNREMDLRAVILGRTVTDRNDAGSLLPVAEDSTGTPILMSISIDHFGWIYDYDEDIEFDDAYGPRSTLDELSQLVLAESFTEFLHGLHVARAKFPAGFEITDAHLKALQLGGYEDKRTRD